MITGGIGLAAYGCERLLSDDEVCVCAWMRASAESSAPSRAYGCDMHASRMRDACDIQATWRYASNMDASVC